MFFSSSLRPEPRPKPESSNELIIYGGEPAGQELERYIREDRKEGETRLLVTLAGVGATIEIVVFVVIYHLSRRIITPVKDTYEKQKLFIANASHELKTPLAVIQANLEALDVDKSNEKWCNNIEHEVAQASSLVSDLLSLARLDAGDTHGNSKIENFDLASEIQEHIERFRPKFEGKITFKTSDAKKLYELPRQGILQVFDILLDNATKYGKKKIVVELSQDSLSVKNDGAKIDKSEREKIFDRFYQTDKTREGSGLGLAIAKSICQRDGFKIACHEEDNMTKFVIRL